MTVFSYYLCSSIPDGHKIRTYGETKEDVMPALVKQQQLKTNKQKKQQKNKQWHSFVCNHTNQINIYGSKVSFYTLTVSTERPLYTPCISIYYKVH